MRKAKALALLLLGIAISTAETSLAEDLQSLEAFGLIVAQQSRPSFAIIGAGARAAGMGGAFTALADDASAASFNPAGLALLLRPEASIVTNGLERKSDYDGFAAVEDGVPEIYGPSSSSFSTNGLNFASFTLPFEIADRNFTFQLSHHRAIDFTFRSERQIDEFLLDGTAIAELEQDIRQEGSVSTLSIAAGGQLTERLSVGLTLSRWTGSWDFHTSSLESSLQGEGSSFYRFSQANEWSGWNMTAGLLLRYHYLNVGASVRTPFDGDFDVDSSLETSFESPFVPESSFSGKLHWPSSYSIGVAVKPFDTWIITGEYSEFDWDDMVIEGLGDEPVNFFDLKPSSESSTQNSGQWRLGTELTFLPGRDVVALRGGYFVEPEPQRLVPEKDPSPVRGISLGAGWRRGAVSLDLAYQRSESDAPILEFVDPQTVESGVVEAQALGHVEVVEQRFFFSVLYQWDSRKSLGRLFRFLFVAPLEPADDPPSENEE